MAAPKTIRLGTRGSALARWQTDHIADLLRAAHPGIEIIITVLTTRGDQQTQTPLPELGGEGLFTAEIETALRNQSIDFAVHSLKDLPTNETPGLALGAIPRRGPVNDVLVSCGGHTLETLPLGASVGSSSRRRAAQLLRARPDLLIVDIRGNVDTRIRKALDPDGPYDAIVLAQAGIERLGRADVVSQVIPLGVILPAPGQGALAVQCRAEPESRTLLAPLDHAETRASVTAERAFLAGLGGGCSTPVAAYYSVEGGRLSGEGLVLSLDGSRLITVAMAGHPDNAAQVGAIMAQQALSGGAGDLLAGMP